MRKEITGTKRKVSLSPRRNPKRVQTTNPVQYSILRRRRIEQRLVIQIATETSTSVGNFREVLH
jgi:hypothetical protein